MIITLCLWLLLSLIFIEAGRVALGSRASSLLLCFFIGFSAVGALAQFLSILMPLGDIFLPAILLSLLLPYLLNYKSKTLPAYSFYSRFAGTLRHMNRLQLLVLISGSLFILYKTSVVPHNYDSGLYHVQSIKWIEEYPAIPGLANIDLRQGFNSIWFTACAFTSFSFSGTSYHVLNGLLYLFVFALGIKAMAALSRKEFTASNWIGLLMPFSFFIFVKNLSSPSPDMPAAVFCWLSLYYFLDHKKEDEDHTVTVSLLSAFAVVIKLSVLPVLLLPLLMFRERFLQGNKRPFFEGLFIILLILAPWAAKNLIVSGYLLFPSGASALIDTDWKVPVEQVDKLARTVKAWAHVPARPAEEVLAMPYSEWLPLWFNSPALVMPYDKVFLFLFIAGIVYRLIRLLVRKDFELYTDSAWLLCAGGIMLWFMLAPDFRFAYGFLLPGIVLSFRTALVAAFNWVSDKIPMQPFLMACLFSLMAVSLYFYSRVFIKDSSVSGLILKPEPYPQTEALQTVELQNQNIHIIFDADCQRWAAPLPAICDISILEQLQFRGNKLNNGFRTRSKQ